MTAENAAAPGSGFTCRRQAGPGGCVGSRRGASGIGRWAVDEHLSVPTDKGANARLKICYLQR